MNEEIEKAKSLLIQVDNIFLSKLAQEEAIGDEHSVADVEIARKHLKNCFNRVKWFRIDEEPKV